jgi:hypothetical protein
MLDTAGYFRDGNRIVVQCSNPPPGCGYVFDVERELNPDGRPRYPCGRLECGSEYEGPEYASDAFDRSQKVRNTIYPESFTQNEKLSCSIKKIILHKKLEYAKEIAEVHGFIIRPTIVNGEYLYVDRDYNPRIINVELSAPMIHIPNKGMAYDMLSGIICRIES